jgi:hypothetical protein
LAANPCRSLKATGQASQKVVRNTLKIVGDSTSGKVAKVMKDDVATTLASAYTDSQGNPVFLWDLTASIPDAIALNDTILYPQLVSMVPPRQEYKVFNDHADIIFNKHSLFDTLFFSLDYAMDTATNLEKVYIGNPEIPIKGSIKAILKPRHQVADTEHAGVYQINGKNNYAFAGGTWKEGHIEFKLRNFGVFTILEDTVPPKIKPLIIDNQRIVFKIKDELSGLQKITASINGEWLLIAQDPKKNLYWAEKKEDDASYSGDLKLEVTDNAHNVKIYTTKIR